MKLRLRLKRTLPSSESLPAFAPRRCIHPEIVHPSDRERRAATAGTGHVRIVDDKPCTYQLLRIVDGRIGKKGKGHFVNHHTFTVRALQYRVALRWLIERNIVLESRATTPIHGNTKSFAAVASTDPGKLRVCTVGDFGWNDQGFISSIQLLPNPGYMFFWIVRQGQADAQGICSL